MHGTRRLLACGALAAGLSLSGCGTLEKPERRAADAKQTKAAAPREPVSEATRAKYPPDSAERAVLNFVRALQVRNWFEAYYRLSDPVLRQSVDFRRFQIVATILYDRSFLPFEVKRVDRSPGRRAVVLEINNPNDGSHRFDTYELTRRGDRWFVVFATSISSALLTLQAQERVEARRR